LWQIIHASKLGLHLTFIFILKISIFFISMFLVDLSWQWWWQLYRKVMFQFLVVEQYVDSKYDSCFVVFSLKSCWWCEILWLLMEFRVAKELVVECAVWVAMQLDLVFMFFFFSYARYEYFDSYFKVSRTFLYVMCVHVVRNECYD